MDMASSLKKCASLLPCVGLIVAAQLMLTGCDPFSAIFCVGGTLGAAAADERGVGGVASDTWIRTKINGKWLAYDASHRSELLDHVTLSVIQGVVVLTGVVETSDLKKAAVDMAKGVTGVREVVDEIRVGKPETLGDYARDAAITTKLKTTLLADDQVASRNFSLRTVNRVIYVTGIAQNQQEIDRVLAHARQISGAKRVVNHVQVLTSSGALVRPVTEPEAFDAR